ncbi:MAG: 16S rRNA (cytidine(1402)-2'-O)-methyltransferase [Candidatus Neomarinimicrobiota bacterium]|nr:MAG: 16S rRNA (cytidine(1402)-2'-O)-methyltransferase [Candidatus Neomarinimicrobiota bacterium]
MTATRPYGVAYIVATPIGNLQDISFRAVAVLKAVPLIAAEDTRHTRILLNHYGITTPCLSYFEHNRFTRIPRIVDHLKSGQDIAVVTDAGTPGISDPAYKLIRAVIQEEIRVEVIPGPTAVITALVTSGLPTDQFFFEGFLPVKKGRKSRLNLLKQIPGTLVLYESPRRLPRTLRDLAVALGDRPAVVCRELTKIHEEIHRGTLSGLASHYEGHPPKGECVILVGKDDPNVWF